MSHRHVAIVVALTPLVALAAVETTLAHARLVRASPAPSSTLKAAPRLVRAVFNEELDPRGSTLIVTDARGRRVDDGRGGVDLDDLDRKTLVVRLRALGPGTYTVRWRATSADDQFVASGSFRFTIGR